MFNKRYRNAQRVMDVEARAVGAAAGELEGAARAPAPASTGEITDLLGGMVSTGLYCDFLLVIRC